MFWNTRRSASNNKSALESKLESSVRSSRDNSNSRIYETKDPIQTNLTESQDKYSRVPSYTSSNYTTYNYSINDLTNSFQTFSFTDNRNKENYPEHTSSYSTNSRDNCNDNTKEHRIMDNSYYPIQEPSSYTSYPRNSTAKPIYGSSAYDSSLAENAAKRDHPNQIANPKYSEPIATNSSDTKSVPKESMSHQQSKDSNINHDTTTERVSLRNDFEKLSPKQTNSSSNTTSLDMKKQDVPEHQESKTLAESTPKRQFLERGGLPNTGLTCYVNSILQCLFASEPLMKEINNIKWPGESTNLFRKIYRYTLARLDYNDWFAVKGLIKDLVSVLGFDNSTEDDAHAFYITLTEKLMEEHVSLDKFFLGEFRITSDCKGCGPINPYEESFTELALPSKKKCFKRSLGACIEYCFKPTKIECCKCRLSKIRKKNLICAPEILVLLSEKDVREDIWIEEMISIPMNEERIRYTLFGIVDYKGSGKFGHYTAITWNEKKRRYFKYDDSAVSDYLLTDRLVNSSLLCFYEKY